MDDFQWPTPDEVAQMREGVEARKAEIREELMNEWVAVSDRLPKSCANVLVAIRWNTGNAADDVTDDVYIAGYDAYGDCWQDAFGVIGDGVVTHWMPLPEPPK